MSSTPRVSRSGSKESLTEPSGPSALLQLRDRGATPQIASRQQAIDPKKAAKFLVGLIDGHEDTFLVPVYSKLDLTLNLNLI